MNNRFFFIFLCFSFICFSQQKEKNEVDSLSQLSYGILIDNFYNTSNLSRQEVFTESILQKAKKEKDTQRIKVAYFFYSEIYYNKRQKPRLKYLDSLITIARLATDKNFPLLAYQEKGIFLHENRDFKGAIEAFTRAHEYAQTYNNISLLYSSNYYIARLKDRIGKHKEALSIHKKNTDFAKENIAELGNLNYLNSIFALAFTHKNLRNLDSASYYNDLGLKLSDEFDEQSIKFYFNMNIGVVQYLRKDHDSAKLKIKNSKDHFESKEDLPNLSEAYFYLGKIAYDQGHKKEAIRYFKKVDTIFTQINDLLPELRENYILLSKYYKSKEDLSQQLLYTEKLNAIDSILNNNHIYISDYLKNEYDIPKIVSEKQGLINSLKKGNQSKATLIYIGLITFFLIITFLYRRQQVFKKRFEKLLVDKHENSDTNNAKILEEVLTEKPSLEVPKELVDNILKGLATFESNNGFLDSSVKLSTLAKLLETNTNYLSKIINHFKEKNINLYLNDLRVEYSIQKLKKDTKFRNYTIKAIAYEVGFKSSETFSKTFYKKTGIYPSYFIKKLNESDIL